MNPVNILSPYFLRPLSVITLSYGPSSLFHGLQFIFSIISHLFLCFLGGSFLLVYISFTFHLHCISVPSYSCRFEHPSNVRQRVKIIQPFITELSPFFCSDCCLTSLCVFLFLPFLHAVSLINKKANKSSRSRYFTAV